jgi:hypothetical protein
MTIIRTYRPGNVAPSQERVFRDPVLAGAWADFMALAGYVVEIEGGAI